MTRAESPKGADETRRSLTHLARSAMAGANVGIVIADGGLPDIPLVYVNAEFERITGYSFDDVVGRNCRLLQGAETDPSDVAKMRTAIADQVPIDLTLRNYRRDGRPFWNQLRIMPVYAPERPEPYYVGYSRVIELPLEARVWAGATPTTDTAGASDSHLEPFFGITDVEGRVIAIGGAGRDDKRSIRSGTIGAMLWDLFQWRGHPEVRELFVESLGRARSGTPTYRDVETVDPGSGSKRWSELRVTPRFEDGGAVRDVLVSLVDITERWSTERFREQLAQVIENSPDAIVSVADDGRATFANRAAHRMFETGVEGGVTGRSLAQLVESTGVDIDPSFIARIPEGEAWEALGSAVVSPRRRKPVSIAILRHHTASARDNCSLILRDRTEVERRQRRLLAELETARILDSASTLADTMPDVVEKLVETTGATGGEYLVPAPDSGWSRVFRVGAGESEAPVSPTTQALAQRAWTKHEPAWEWSTNPPAPPNAVAEPAVVGAVAVSIPTESTPLGVIILHLPDPSIEHREWEEGLTNVVRSLRDFHRWEQTASELRAARLAADAASQAKSRFLGTMSHELRTPMAAILGYAELLLPRVDPESRAMLDVVIRNGHHMVDMLNDILDLTRVEEDRIDLAKEPCSPVAMAYDLASLMQVRAAEKGLRFETRYEGVLPREIQTDYTRVRQILINLVGNAIRFTEDGEVSLVLRGDLDRPDPRIVFEVVDTGIGIAPKHLDSVFNPFEQGDPTTSRKYGGTGLGLAISERLARALDATLTARSEVGVGSTFTLALPVSTAAASDTLTQEHLDQLISDPKADPHIPQTKLQGRYLVVDDHEAMRQLVTYHLTRAGATVEQAADGSEAVRLVEEIGERGGEPYQAVVMDMQMPVMDGYQATRIISARAPETPVVALSAGAMTGDREKALEAGCVSFLAKPVNGAKLLTLLAELSPERRGEYESPSTKTRVLLVEDDRDLGEVISRVLSQEGAAVRLSTTGAEAIQVAKEWRPPWVLLDMNLPDMSGLEVHEALVEHLGTDTRFVAMSGDASARAECLAAGFSDFHLKPVGLDVLQRVARGQGGT